MSEHYHPTKSVISFIGWNVALAGRSEVFQSLGRQGALLWLDLPMVDHTNQRLSDSELGKNIIYMMLEHMLAGDCE